MLFGPKIPTPDSAPLGRGLSLAHTACRGYYGAVRQEHDTRIAKQARMKLEGHQRGRFMIKKLNVQMYEWEILDPTRQ